MTTPARGQRWLGKETYREGFSLIELLVAMAVFLTVSAASFTLFSRHQALLSQEQNSVGLNIGLRNALTQIQLDAVNAGDGLILGTNVPAWPVGLTIQNSNPTTAQCNPTPPLPVYAAACFDQLNVIMADPNTPAIHPCATAGCSLKTSSVSSLYGQPSSLYTAGAIAGNFHTGDQILIVQSCSGGGHTSGSSGCAFTTAVLTAAGTTSTAPPGCTLGCVNLAFNTTLAGGGNNASNDPLGLTTNTPAAKLTDTFQSTDWVVRLAPITFKVDTTNTADPQLIRTVAGASAVLMDQVIAFKVGAALWNNNTSTFQYNYNSATYSNGSTADPNDFSLIRSIRISLIGRTQANPIDPYRNTFDSGPYQVRGNSIIINPRNLTMNND